jgi:hypothetical protein
VPASVQRTAGLLYDLARATPHSTTRSPAVEWIGESDSRVKNKNPRTGPLDQKVEATSPRTETPFPCFHVNESGNSTGNS